LYSALVERAWPSSSTARESTDVAGVRARPSLRACRPGRPAAHRHLDVAGIRSPGPRCAMTPTLIRPRAVVGVAGVRARPWLRWRQAHPSRPHRCHGVAGFRPGPRCAIGDIASENPLYTSVAGVRPRPSLRVRPEYQAQRVVDESLPGFAPALVARSKSRCGSSRARRTLPGFVSGPRCVIAMLIDGWAPTTGCCRGSARSLLRVHPQGVGPPVHRGGVAGVHPRPSLRDGRVGTARRRRPRCCRGCLRPSLRAGLQAPPPQRPVRALPGFVPGPRCACCASAR
jgi:hypothetical protein